MQQRGAVAHQRILVAIVAALSGFALLPVATAEARLPSYNSPGYKGTRRAPATKPGPLPKPIALSSSGLKPNVFVDAAGTAHITWSEDDGDAADVVRYCRLRRGSTRCDNPPSTQRLVPDKPYGVGDDPRFNVDNDGPRVLAVGDQLVLMTHRYPTVFPKPDGSDQSSTTLIWVSDDGGSSFTGPAVVGDGQISGGAVAFGPDDDPTLATITDTVTGGTFVQAIHPGSYTSAKVNLQTGADQAYSGSLALSGGLPVAAYDDLTNHIYIRRWSGREPFGDPGTWSPPTVLTGQDSQLAGGPRGLYLIERPGYGKPYEVRRVDGASPGRPVKIATAGAPGVLKSFFQDPSGRLLAAWTDRNSRDAGVRLRTSTDGRRWSAMQTLLRGANAGQTALGAAADGGGFAAINTTGGINSPGPIAAVAFGASGATGRKGLGGLTGGSGDQSATSGCQRLTFGSVVVRGQSGCFLRGTGSAARMSVTTGPLNLNGLQIVPDAGVKILIDPRAHTLDTTGSVSVELSGGGIGPITLWHGELHVKLPNAGAGQTLFSFDTSRFGVDLLGFGVRGRVDVILGADSVRVPIALALPPILGDVRGQTELVADGKRGLHIDSLHVHVGNVFAGPLLIDYIDLDYSGAGDVWRGAAGLHFPPPGLGGALKAEVEFDMGRYKHGAISYEPPPPGIVIGPFVYLTKIGGELDLDPTHLAALATVAAGASVNGVSPVSVDGRFDMTFPPRPKPVDFKMSGTVKVLFVGLADGFLDFQGDGYAAFGGHAGLDLSVLTLDANANGFVDGSSGAFGADARAQMCVDIKFGPFSFPCVAGELAMNNAGFAACAEADLPDPVGHQSAGIELAWSDVSPAVLVSPPALAYTIASHLTFPCHTDAYRSPPRAATARLAAAGDTTVTVPAGVPTETIALFGDGGPPRVTLRGPRGEAPAAGSATITNAPAGATYVKLNRPAAGTWTISLEPGSPAVKQVLQSDGYTPARVSARLGGRGRARAIRYSISGLGHGQTVIFAERGRFGTRIVGRARSARGLLRFAPADARGGRRAVLALVRHRGMVTDTVRIGTYVAPGPVRPAHVSGVRLRRRGNSVTVSWRGVRGAARYVVRVRGSHGMRRMRLLSARSRKLRVSRLAPGDRLAVSVAALSRTGREGPAGKAVERAPRKPRRPHRRRR